MKGGKMEEPKNEVKRILSLFFILLVNIFLVVINIIYKIPPGPRDERAIPLIIFFSTIGLFLLILNSLRLVKSTEDIYKMKYFLLILVYLSSFIFGGVSLFLTTFARFWIYGISILILIVTIPYLFKIQAK